MAKVLRRIIDIIFILVIILLISYFALRYFKIIEIYQVETGSMEDGIHPGDYVLIIKKEKYDVGDIVTYTTDNYYVTHRIVKESGTDAVITKGDANNTEDDKISRQSIIGKVILIGGFLNVLIDFKYSVVGFFIILYLISCYIGKDKEIEQNENEEETKDDESATTMEEKVAETEVNETVKEEASNEVKSIEEKDSNESKDEDSTEEINQVDEKTTDENISEENIKEDNESKDEIKEDIKEDNNIKVVKKKKTNKKSK